MPVRKMNISTHPLDKDCEEDHPHSGSSKILQNPAQQEHANG